MVCGRPMASLSLLPSPFHSLGLFPWNWGRESYQVGHLLSFQFCATSIEKCVRHHI